MKYYTNLVFEFFMKNVFQSFKPENIFLHLKLMFFFHWKVNFIN